MLAFTFSQMAMPLIIQMVVDDVLLTDAGSAARGLLFGACAVFAGLILVNYVANLIQESVVARVGGAGAVRYAPRHV